MVIFNSYVKLPEGKYNIWLVVWKNGLPSRDQGSAQLKEVKEVVVWNMNGLLFPYIGNFIIPTDELIFFGGVETTNQIYIVKWDNSSIGKKNPTMSIAT